MEDDAKQIEWIPLWTDKRLIQVVKDKMKPTWQKILEKLIPKGLKLKLPFIEVEYKTQLKFGVDVEKLSKRLKVQPPAEVYQQFAFGQNIKIAISQVAGTLYYPMWAPTYIRLLFQFLLNVPGIPPDLKSELETKHRLPDRALQHELVEAMETKGQYSFDRYFIWVKRQYPGIEKDFEAYLAKERPGYRREIEGLEYCLPNFGHPSQPELFIYFPREAKEHLPPPNGHMLAKVIGLVSHDAEPPPGVPIVHLRGVCLFGGIEKK